MKFLGRIYGWITTWNSPVPREVILLLEAASARATNANPAGKTYAYWLLTGRKDILILSRQHKGLKYGWTILSRILQGRPVSINLSQENVTGILGPHAKARKRQRTGRNSKENAVLFWPAPGGKIHSNNTRFVLKIALGKVNLAREIHMMKRLAALPGIAPQCLSNDPALRWVKMNFIASNPNTTMHVRALKYLESATGQYFRYWGVKSITVQFALKRYGLSFPEFTKAMQDSGIDRNVICAAHCLTASIIHGGRTCEECIETADGKIVMMDWEKAGLALLAQDFLHSFPLLPDETVQHMQKLVRANDLPVIEQLIFATITRSLQQLRKKYPDRKKLALDAKCIKLLKSRLT